MDNSLLVLDAQSQAIKDSGKTQFWYIWNMSFGFFGIQFGWALQMANMSAIYEYLGASAEAIPGLWLAAPLTGLIVQPIIGYMSDNTWNKYGRRKPYFMVGAILASLALIAMPNVSSLWMAAGLLWILDASINISMEPFRAFIADLLPHKLQTRGYAMQTVFIGAGAVIASSLPWIFTNLFSMKTAAGANGIPQNVVISFYLGAVFFFCAVLYTVLTTKEIPPSDAEIAKLQQAKGNTSLPEKIAIGAKEIFHLVMTMPKVMRQLSLVQFFTWPGLFFMWFFFSTAVARNILGATDTASALYKEGIEWGGLCFGFYSLVTFGFAFLLPSIAQNIGKKWTHALCLTIGGIGLISTGFIHTKLGLFFPMTCVGIAWASILSMPYSILVKHLPKKNLGLYVGIFNFFIVLPEILAALFFGNILKNYLNDNRLTAVMLGGCLLIFAAILTSFVTDTEVTSESQTKHLNAH